MNRNLSVIEQDSFEASYHEIEAEAANLDHWCFMRYKEGLATKRQALEASLQYYAGLIADPDNAWELETLMEAAAAVRGAIAAVEKAGRELVFSSRNGKGKES